MDLKQATELYDARADMIGERMIERDNHAGPDAGIVTDVRLRPNGDSHWLCFVISGVECGGDIRYLSWSDAARRLSSQFGMHWEFQ